MTDGAATLVAAIVDRAPGRNGGAAKRNPTTDGNDELASASTRRCSISPSRSRRVSRACTHFTHTHFHYRLPTVRSLEEHVESGDMHACLDDFVRVGALAQSHSAPRARSTHILCREMSGRVFSSPHPQATSPGLLSSVSGPHGLSHRHRHSHIYSRPDTQQG